MMKIICVILTILFIYSCHDMSVGYLEYDHAKYSEDKMIVKKELNPEEDAEQIELKYHWVSLPIEGIIGTQPIFMELASVITDTGDVDIFMKEVSVRGNGTIDVPYDHHLPIGTYKVTLKVYNEDHAGMLYDIFTVIVE